MENVEQASLEQYVTNPETPIESRAVEPPAEESFGSFSVVSPSGYFRWKSLVSRLIAMLLLIPGLFVICILMALIRVTSKGPTIFKQKRVGLNGRVFTMYKMRSMRLDAEDGTGPAWSTKGDPRVTPLGRLLRDHHLDELPQLFNVLRGDMDLFGPRPERPEFVQVLEDRVPGYTERLRVRPGISGLAQINLPPDTDVDSVRRKLCLDLEYIDHATFWLDFRMFIATLLRLLGMPGDTVMRMMKLERKLSGFEQPEPGTCRSLNDI